MKSRDILKALARHEITVAEAYDIYDQIMDSPYAASVESLLGLSHIEWNAFGHGAPFEVLARWRTNGWPAVCVNCKQVIVVSEFGWMVSETEDGYGLYHIECPSVSLRRDPGDPSGLRR